ncbi:MAG: MMPL family transporter [Pseudomonadota bacterium]
MPVKSRTVVDRFAVGFTEFVLSQRILVILATVIAVFALATQAKHLSFENNYRVFFSDENPELQAFENLQATYTQTDNVFFYVRPKDGRDVFEPQTMSAIADITEESWQIPHSIRVDSVTNFQYTYAEEDDLIVEDLIYDPASLSAEEYAEKREIALAEPILERQLVTSDGGATAVNVTLQFPQLSNDEVPNVAFAARDIRERMEEKYPDLTFAISGGGLLNMAFMESGLADNTTLVPLMFLVVVLLTFVTVRSFSATIALFLVIVLSVLTTVGAAGVMRVPLTPISLSSLIVVLTLAVADGIHILLTFRQNMQKGMPKREALIDAIRVNFLAVGITSLTTIVGFMALNFSDSPPFWHLGNMSAVGIFAAWALSVTFFPAMLSLLPAKAALREDYVDRHTVMDRFADFVLPRRNVFALLSLAGVVALVAMIPRMDLNDQWTKYFGERIEFRRDTDVISQHFGLFTVDFSVEAGEPSGIYEPEYLQRLDAFAEWLETQPNVAHVYSMSDIMKRLNKNLNADDPEFYRLPEDRELAAQYLLLYELSLPYGLDLNDRINIDKSATRLTVTMEDGPTQETKDLLIAATAYLEENFPEDLRPIPTSTQVMFTFITDRNVQQMIEGTVIAILAISAIMIFTFRSVKLGILSLVPNTLPIATAFGAWALLVGEIGFSVSVVAAISLGIVVDDTVHLITKYVRARREQGLSAEDAIRYSFNTVGLAIIVNTIILSIGFSVLMFSTFKVTVDMGLLTSLSIVFALVLDFLLLPALLIWTDGDRSTQTNLEATDAAPNLSAA